MWRKIGDWFAAVTLVSALATAAFGAAEWVEARRASVTAAADAYTVVVDAGHGGADGGAVGTESGVAEAGLNLAVAQLLSAELSARGVRVIMTRQDGAALAATKQKDMAARRGILRTEGADLAVSIHMNKFPDRSVSGAMTYYMRGSEEGRALAQCVIDSLCDATGRNRRLANPGDYYVLRESICPAVIVECGFLSNAGEEEKLQDPAHQAILARAVADGTEAYLHQKKDAGNGAVRLQQRLSAWRIDGDP